MRTYLDWIGIYPIHAFFLGCFILALAGLIVNGISNFFVKVTRSITGKYPPAGDVVECPCSEQCSYHESDDEDD